MFFALFSDKGFNGNVPSGSRFVPCVKTDWANLIGASRGLQTHRRNQLIYTVAYRLVAKRWLCKQRPLLGNARNIHVRTGQRCYATRFLGRAITQAVSRRLHTAAARVRAWVRSCWICDGESGTEAGFLRVLQFPPPIRILPTAPQSSLSFIRGWYSRQNSGRNTKWTQSQSMKTAFLSNGSEETPLQQWSYCWKRCFLFGLCKVVIKKIIEKVKLRDIRRTRRTWVREHKESPLLTSVTRKRLLKTLLSGEDLVFAAMICKVWRSAMAL
jgi:hypothetical protein